MNSVIDIDISRLVSSGQGAGSDGLGNLYFVPGTVPGDRCRVEYSPTSKRFRDARLLEILRPSVDRVEPVCKVFGVCGGCDWLHLNYQAQLHAKEGFLTHILERVGVTPRERLPILGADPVLGYRNRVQVRKEGSVLGFYRRKSHEIIDVETCPVADARLNESLALLRHRPPTDARTKIELALDDAGRVVELTNRAHAAAGFSQIHSGQNQVLQKLVADWVANGQSERVLELFAGDGNLTEAYANSVQEVVAVELGQASIEKARRKIENGRLPVRVTFLERRVDASLWRGLAPEFADRCDTLIVDPPRTGMGASLGEICRPPVKNFIYISCSPTTFAQDVLSILHRYTLDTVVGLDMFPQTRHLEIASLWKLR